MVFIAQARYKKEILKYKPTVPNDTFKKPKSMFEDDDPAARTDSFLEGCAVDGHVNNNFANNDDETVLYELSEEEEEEEKGEKKVVIVNTAATPPSKPEKPLDKPAEFQGMLPESSQNPIDRQSSPDHDSPAPARARAYHGRGRGGFGSTQIRNSRIQRAPTGDLSDIVSTKTVGTPIYDNVVFQDTVERGMHRRRAPLTRETSLLNLEDEEEKEEQGGAAALDSSPGSAWPKLDAKNGGVTSADEFLLVIQQAAEAFAKQMVQCQRVGLSKLCREVDALLHDFLIHVCYLGDQGAFVNYHELQTGIHEVIGDMANALATGAAPAPRVECSAKFMRPASQRAQVGEQIQMPLLEFLRKVPDRFLASKVRPLNTVAKRLGSVANEVRGNQPEYIYEYLVYNTATDGVPHNLSAVLVAEFCRLISKSGKDGSDLRFRVTIGTIIFYSMLRVIDIAEEQIATHPAMRNGVSKDYLSAAVEAGIVKMLGLLCSGKMRDICAEAISELLQANPAASVASSSSTIVTATIGHQRSVGPVLSEEEIRGILARKEAVERGQANGGMDIVEYARTNGKGFVAPHSSVTDAVYDDVSGTATPVDDGTSNDATGGCLIL